MIGWTADDDALVKAGQEAGESWADIAKRLPGRSADSVKSRSKRLKRQPDTSVKHEPVKRELVRWTAADDALVKAGQEAGESWVDIAKRLPGRSAESVKSRSNRLKRQPDTSVKHEPVKRELVRWTAADDALVKAGQEAGESWVDIAKRLPGRSADSVKSRFDRLKRQPDTSVKHEPVKRELVRWTAADDALLKAGQEAGESWVDIAKRLPGRSAESVKSRSNRLKGPADKSAGGAAAQAKSKKAPPKKAAQDSAG
ncbi:hypothetical protein EMIHUDRAFT_232789 [Emiliania huxleyi CCMP1516]|uniref:Myb-like domain-containing protein n=2 Tax=Emiliania huxleyi TaxID=2903 RepID=A0A0D3K3X2_EMIH1|nr:hypothetical protein EMIHUDRAFT_232789 [Emiliania huxleyi CCMP1516]EOD30457.1 hypothetical protein EMIHUDRAFT_232789 [Emiliania huxleyi CCMP1516]|eukprot:XP_005782886.1 hypothetical protein EMIHUDRAFT_232789 [Emiliania huxleyi CCMP1516]